MKSLKEFLYEENVNIKPNMFCIIKPGFLNHKDEFESELTNGGYQILKKKCKTLPLETCKELYKMHSKKDFYNDLCNYMNSDKCIAYSLYKDCDDIIKTTNELKDKLRKKYGKDDMRNFMHSSDSVKNVNRETNIVFNDVIL